MKKITLTLILLAISFITNAQVSIPDANFEGALVIFGMDTDGVVNGQISTTDALAITNLDLINQNVTDLTGVNSMTNLTYFGCYGLNLSNFTFNLPNLETLQAAYNNFTNIDLSGLPNLTTLYISNNSNLVLDVSSLSNLSVLFARNCNLSTYTPYSDVTIYTQIRFSSNVFTGNLDFQAYTNLETLTLSNNTISSLDITGLINLGFLAVDHCGLTGLDVTTNVNLTNLTAIGNNLTCLDLSQNLLLTGVEVNNNDPNLIIVVADVTAANASTGIYQWWYKDVTASYGTTCGTTNTNDFSLANNFNMFPNPITDVLNIQSMQDSAYMLYDINGRSILKGYFQRGINTMDLSSFDSGIYFLKVSALHKSFTRKLILK
jgi:hypothetical protein